MGYPIGVRGYWGHRCPHLSVAGVARASGEASSSTSTLDDAVASFDLPPLHSRPGEDEELPNEDSGDHEMRE